MAVVTDREINLFMLEIIAVVYYEKDYFRWINSLIFVFKTMLNFL